MSEKDGGAGKEMLDGGCPNCGWSIARALNAEEAQCIRCSHVWNEPLAGVALAGVVADEKRRRRVAYFKRRVSFGLWK